VSAADSSETAGPQDPTTPKPKRKNRPGKRPRKLPLSLRQPLAILLCTIFLTAAGIYSLFNLPTAVYPEVAFPRIVILADSGGAPPDVITLLVTKPLEQALAGIPGMTRMRSHTIRGETEINLSFTDDTDIVSTFGLVQARVGAARANLPQDTDIEIERIAASSMPVISFSLTGPYPASHLAELATYVVKPQISRLPGVWLVQVQSGDAREIHVDLDPDRLRSYDLTVTDVSDALQKRNVLTALGHGDFGHKQELYVLDARANSVDDLKNTVVADRPTGPVLVGDLGDVLDTVRDRTAVVTADDQQAVTISISRQESASAVTLSDEIHAALPAIQQALGPDVKLTFVYDQSTLVRDSMKGVRDAILIGIGLAVLVLAMFLRRLRPTLLGALSIPLALANSFLILTIFHQTLNLMSLGGLAIAVGLVIDDAVVILDGIEREEERGYHGAEATARAVRRLRGAVIGSTATTLVVFLPLGLLQGLTGDFFMALSIALGGAVAISLVVSLLVIPAIARRVELEKDAPATKEAAQKKPKQGPGRLERSYDRAIKATLRRPVVAVVVALLLIPTGWLIYNHVESDFLPDMDEGGFVMDYYTPVGTSVDQANEIGRRIEKVLDDTPDVSHYARRLGAELGPAAATESSRGDISVELKPRGERRPIEDVMDDIRTNIEANIPGVRIEEAQIMQDALDDLAGSPRPIEIKFFGDDPAKVTALAQAAGQKLSGIPGLVELFDGTYDPTLELDAKPDPVLLSHLQLSPGDVSDELQADLYGELPTQILFGDRFVPVRVLLPDHLRLDPTQVGDLLIRTPDGQRVPLKAIARLTESTTPSELFRENQRPMVDLTASISGADLRSVSDAIAQRLSTLDVPPGYSYEIAGQAAMQADAFGRMVLVLILAIAGVLVVLVVQFRSLRAPFVILCAAPLSLAGALLALLITGTPLNVSSVMGFILLVGLVVKNGLILLDKTEALRRKGLDAASALRRAAESRLRPILMTTLCTLLGLLPLAAALGAGSELQRPLAIAVIGGLSLSTFVTLFFVPSLYRLLLGREGAERKVSG
jgi:CzcA family heavy metal efflux pump